MDSIPGDMFMGGRRFRPATLEYALQNYPKIIVGLKLGKLSVDAPRACDGNDIVHIVSKMSPVYTWTITRCDYEKCVSIAKKMSVPLFHSDVEKNWIDMASAHVKEVFG